MIYYSTCKFVYPDWLPENFSALLLFCSKFTIINHEDIIPFFIYTVFPKIGKDWAILQFNFDDLAMGLIQVYDFSKSNLVYYSFTQALNCLKWHAVQHQKVNEVPKTMPKTYRTHKEKEK